MSVFDSLVQQPVVNFKVGNYRSPGSLGNVHRISNVITVAVGDKDIICRNFPRLHWGQRVTADERINQQVKIFCFDQNTGVTVPCYCDAHVNLLFLDVQ